LSRRHRSTPTNRLTARARLLINATGLGLWLSGGVWLTLHYFLVRNGAFGPEHSAAEPWWMKIHGAFGFMALWTGGFLWRAHVVKGWRQNRKRWSGGVLIGIIFVLIASGYLLYYAGEDGPRAVISMTHWIIGLGLALAYLIHRWLGTIKSAAERRTHG
jgi:hypothetical protein